LEKAWTAVDWTSSQYKSIPSINDKPHVIVFIYAATSIDDKRESELLREIFQKYVEEYKVKPIVILTHCDEYYRNIFPESKSTIRDLLHSSKLQDLKTKFLKKCGNYLQKGDIHFFANYTSQSLTKDYEKEILALLMMKLIIKRGISQISHSVVDIKVKGIRKTSQHGAVIVEELLTLCDHKLEDCLDQITSKLKPIMMGPFGYLSRDKTVISEDNAAKYRIRDIASVSGDDIIIEVTPISDLI